MRMTSKGQVTIPKQVGDQAGFTTYTELDVRYEDGNVVMAKLGLTEKEREPRRREFEEWLARFKGSADAGLTTDEIIEMTRGPFDDVDPR
jgi:bifunctional DNA-binding transcriptional regulator/antitoxin component of YhaV-PrlF toxin-antitoxin module